MDDLTPIDNLIWHEDCNLQNLLSILESLREGPIREPIHITDDADPIILDGAHRARASAQYGHQRILAHRVSIPDAYVADGWVYAFEPSPSPPSPLGEGPVIAVWRNDGDEMHIRGSDTTEGRTYLRALYSSYWNIANQFLGWPYKLTEEAPIKGPSLQWRPPAWGPLAMMVRMYGPMPASITRFAPLISKMCPDCCQPPRDGTGRRQIIAREDWEEHQEDQPATTRVRDTR